MRVLQTLPETGFLRLPQIIGRAAKGDQLPVAGLIPVSRSTWWSGIRSGRYPKPVKIGKRATAWRVEDIRKLIESASSGKEAA